LSVPDAVLRPLVEKYYSYGYGDKKIVDAISRQIDLLQNEWTLQQRHTAETIGPLVEKIRAHTANRLGSKSLRDHLRHESILVSRDLLRQYQALADPVGNQQRRARRLKHYVHWSTGLHEVWSVDQHDKWKRFGLFLHVGVENFSNFVLWLKVWWTNSNPRLIAGYYLEAAARLGGIPLLTQSDPGTENNGIANAQTTLRRQLDPSLMDTLQHQWMRGHSNIKPEIFWSKLRRQWSAGWEALFQEGVDDGLYDPAVIVELLLFRWLAVPMIQHDLDRFALIHNVSKPRKNSKKKMPAEIPTVLMENPEQFGLFRDYKITVSKQQLQHAADEFAPQEHLVFQLVPEPFERHASWLYNALGRPLVNRSSFWDVYLGMLEGLVTLPN
ncbi:hypothetical protein CALCODRAFT_405924, partial [Calocera cornea HHB12733]